MENPSCLDTYRMNMRDISNSDEIQKLYEII